MAADLREMQENQGFSENLIDKREFVYLFLTKRVIPLTSIDIITHTHSTGDIVGITSNKVPQDSLATLLAPSL